MQKNFKLSMAGLLTIGVLLLVCAFSMSFNILSVTLNPLIDEFQLVGASQGLMASMMSFGSMIPLLIILFLQGRVNKLMLILFGAAIADAGAHGRGRGLRRDAGRGQQHHR